MWTLIANADTGSLATAVDLQSGTRGARQLPPADRIALHAGNR